MKLVENYRGRFIDLDIVAGYMDDDIRERLHSEMSPCEPQAFMTHTLRLMKRNIMSRSVLI